MNNYQGINFNTMFRIMLCVLYVCLLLKKECCNIKSPSSYKISYVNKKAILNSYCNVKTEIHNLIHGKLIT